MKYHLLSIFTFALATSVHCSGQAGATYTNFVRQVQLPTLVIRDEPIQPTGTDTSKLPIDPGGARFELWSVKSSPLTSYLLDTKYVGTYIPQGNVTITTEDPSVHNAIPRTRADRPFYVDITTQGLLSEADAPIAAKSITLLRHVQAYEEGGTGEILDRTQAILLSQASITTNNTQRLTYALTSIPGADRTKIRGEERFSLFSIADAQAPASQISSKFVQIWPVADGTIAGITQNQIIKFRLPQITITVNDTYPDSTTYAQVYQGELRDGVQGTAVPGSAKTNYSGAPESPPPFIINDWDAVITESGRWTLELLTVTPFGTDRLSYVTFNINRSLDVKGTFTTLE